MSTNNVVKLRRRSRPAPREEITRKDLATAALNEFVSLSTVLRPILQPHREQIAVALASFRAYLQLKDDPTAPQADTRVALS